MRLRQLTRPSLSAAAVLIALAAAGCGRSGDVSGRVALRGVTLVGGWMTLTYPGGEHSPVSGAIGADGAYRITGCPTGDARVTVRAVPGRGGVPANAPGNKTSAAKLPPVPAKYADVGNTDLKLAVAGGGQRFDIDLK